MPAPLTIEQLESGLASLSDCATDPGAFWVENTDAFRRTLCVAVRDTSDALLSPELPLRWRLQLERQLSELVGYLDLLDGGATVTSGPSGPVFPKAQRRIH